MNGRFKEGQGFIDLTNQRYGMLTVLEYVGKDEHKRSKWKCLCDCGTTTEEFGAEMKHGSVKSCGCDLGKPRPKRVDFVEFLRRAREKHGDRYDYSFVEYKNTSTHVQIKCNEHGLFSQTPTQHYLKGQGCPKCAYEEKSKAKRSNTEIFIEEAKTRNGGNFDYSRVRYVDSKSTVEILCNNCNNAFTQRADVHLRGSGCSFCLSEKKKDEYRLSTAEYVAKAEAVYNANEHSYERTVYTHCKERINVFCNSCSNNFSIRADTHLLGHGCPCKATHGFDYTKPGTFYVLECRHITKIGITSHPVERRIKDISRDYGVDFTLVAEFLVEDARYCSDVETEMLREMRAQYKQPTDRFDGYTECFYDVDQRELLRKLSCKFGVQHDG